MKKRLKSGVNQAMAINLSEDIGAALHPTPHA
jgi:hypothetical protein